MSNGQVVNFDVLRSIAFGGISGTYVPIGTPFLFNIRLMCITNTTDGDMLISDDGVTNKLIVPATSFKLFDLTSNRVNNEDVWVLQYGTQFYVKQATAPTKGAVYIEGLWG